MRDLGTEGTQYLYIAHTRARNGVNGKLGPFGPYRLGGGFRRGRKTHRSRRPRAGRHALHRRLGEPSFNTILNYTRGTMSKIVYIWRHSSGFRRGASYLDLP